MSTPDTQEKSQAPEKPSAGDAVVSKAEKKASGEAEGSKDNFYENMTTQARALIKAREDGLRTGTHQEFGTPTIAGDDGKALIKGGNPSKITLTEDRLQELMKEQGRGKKPDAALTVDKAFREKAVQGSAEQTGTAIDYKPSQAGDKSFKLGMDYEENPLDTRTPVEKLGDFMQAAAKRATDPEGWKAWAQGEISKFAGIGVGLNEAKEETKAAVAAGWKALTDGTVVEFLSQPNAINAPVFKTVANAFGAMGKDPNAVNHAFEALGKAVMKASEGYSNLPDYEKGKVIGKAMFGMVNPEGSAEGAEAALKIADQVATKVDKAAWDTIGETVKSIKVMAPDAAEQTKQMLYDFIKTKGLTGPQLEAAGFPRGYFDGMQEPPGGGKGDNFFAMSKADEGAEGLPKRAGDREPMPEKIPVSERFKAELAQATETLSKREREFLDKHGIEIKPVKRITDVPGTSEDLAGCYKEKAHAIYVPEEILQRGQWVQNNDVPFILRHEFGHAFNANARKFGEWLSNARSFARVFTEDFDKIPPELRDTLLLSEKSKPIELARDEVFSDMYAHTTGLQSNNPYSQLLKKYFPSCLKYLEDMPKW